MQFSTVKLPPPPPTPPPFSFFPRSSKFTNPNPKLIQLKSQKQNHKKALLFSLKHIQISNLKSNDRNPNFRVPETPTRSANVADKLQCLVSEFKSLPEPIDRVKRLLHYAALLPPFEESGRVNSNRVMGCTAQVWLEVWMEEEGAMRFRVDSDSEITKGFCSCLIWLLDGAAPAEVVAVKTEDLVEMNVGLKANSRVNTWHNVLINMQKRTTGLVEERAGGSGSGSGSEPFTSLFIAAGDGISAIENYTEPQVLAT